MIKKSPTIEWDQVAEWWNSEAGDAGVWHQQHDIDPVIFEILGNVKNKRIIEIGCGNGYLARLLARKGAIVTAIDSSSKLLAFAIAEENKRPFGIKYLVRDAVNLRGIKKKYFDIAVANMSLMDMADAKGAIKEIARVLKRSGHFVFSITHPVFGDFRQQWVIIKKNGKKYFSRAISKYISSAAEQCTLWANGIKTTQYHRSVETYFKYLKSANLLVSDFREIVTKKPVTKAEENDGGVKFRRSKYTTLGEKKIKEFAGREIPYFLIIDVFKIK